MAQLKSLESQLRGLNVGKEKDTVLTVIFLFFSFFYSIQLDCF